MIHDRPLGRRPPEDWEHVDRYPLPRSMAEAIVPTPIVIGVNWYSNFDTPRDDAGNVYAPGRTPVGNWWIGRSPDLGRIRGGHCVCLKPRGVARRPAGSWRFYDQGSEGACVGFGGSQAMSILNLKFYFARWIWDRCKEIDYWSDTNPGDDRGTSVKALGDVLREQGHVVWSSSYEPMNTDGEGSDWVARSSLRASSAEGIAANRWISDMDDVLAVLGYGDKDYVDIMNSWGQDYPSLTRMPVETLERLRREDGELMVVTDR